MQVQIQMPVTVWTELSAGAEVTLASVGRVMTPGDGEVAWVMTEPLTGNGGVAPVIALSGHTSGMVGSMAHLLDSHN